MRRKKIQFIQSPCRRGCGTMLTTANRSMWGLGELKAKYELICGECLTRAEKEEMLANMGKGIIGNLT